MTTIHTQFGEGEVVEVEHGRLGKTRYKVAGYGFEVWLDASDPAIHTAADAFSYGPQMEMMEAAGRHVPGTPSEEPHSGHSANEGWGIHGSNPRDRSGDAWAESRDRGWAEHGQQDLHHHDDYDAVGSPWGGFDDGPPRDGEIHTTQSPGYHHSDEDDFRGPFAHTGASFDFEPTSHAWDNSTTLPYNWEPQYPVDMFRHEQTQSPDHEIDRKERMHPSDSRSGEDREPIHEYPGPNPDLFAKEAWTLHDEEDQGHQSEDDRWDQYNQHAQHGIEHVGGSDDPETNRWPFVDNHPQEELPPLHHEFLDDSEDDNEPAFRPGHEPDYGQQAQDFARSQRMQDANHEWQDAYRNQPWGPDHPDYDGVEIPPEHRAQPHEPSWQDHVNADAERVQQHVNHDTSNPAHPDYLPPHQGSWDRPAGLSDKYADIHEAADHSTVGRFRQDPYGTIVRHGARDLDAGLDHETGEEMRLVEADHDIRTAAWGDVRTKAVRLVREGAVTVEAMDSNAIYANVDGDHGRYEVMILTGAAYPSGGFSGGKRAIANWKCSCRWGKWAFKRQFTFVGRLCSHGYATYLTQQSHSAKTNPHHFKKPRKTSGVDQFKTWIKDENSGHVDTNAADSFLSTQDQPVTRDEAQKIYDYVENNHSEHPERDYGAKGGYQYDNDSEVLQHQPGKLGPHVYVVPDEHYHEFEDLGDDRKTTGPDQIQAHKIAKGEISEHHPAFAWHMNDEPDFPEGGIVHFSSLTYTAEEDLINKLRSLAQEPAGEHLHDMQSHNQEVSRIVDELNDRGYAASQFVAMKKTADPNDGEPIIPSSPSDWWHQFQNSPVGGALGLGGNEPGYKPYPDGKPGGGGPGLAADVKPAGGVPPPKAAVPATTPATTPPAGPGVVGGGAGQPGPASPKATFNPTTGGGFDPGAGGAWHPSNDKSQLSQNSVYVEPGDTLSGIAGRAGVGVDQLQAPSGNPNMLHPGDKINIPTNQSFKGEFGKGIQTPSSGGGNGLTQTENSGNNTAFKGTFPATTPAAATPAAAPKPATSAPGAGATMDAQPKSPAGMSGSGTGVIKPLPGVGIGKASAQHFAERYFRADTAEGPDTGDDSKRKNVAPSAPNAGAAYKPVSNPGTPVNAPRPQGPPADPMHGIGSNPAGAPPAGTPGPASPTTTTGTPGQQKQEQPQGQGAGGMGGGDFGSALNTAMGVAGPLIGEMGNLAGGLGGGGGALSGLAGGLGGALSSGLGGVLHGLHLGSAEHFAAQYFQADGAFLGQGGGNWMDYPFAGSGPDRQDWSTTSEDYVKEHELPKRSETWMTDNDGDVTKYTDRPKQKKADIAGSGDAGYGSTGGIAGGTISLGEGGGNPTHAESGSAAPTMGQLTNTARIAFGPGEDTGYFNPHNPKAQPIEDELMPGKKRAPKKPPGEEGDEEGEDNGLPRAFGGGGLAEELPKVAFRRDDSDVVRQFHASGGGFLNESHGDDSIAERARGMLRTAGRNYTLAEQRELEDEFHPRGARNLAELDLRGTHYEDE